MTRFLRAWAWLRWRTFMNAIEHSERADRIARFSRAAEVLGPVLVAVMMIPSAAMAMALGVATGYGMGSGASWGTTLMHAMRIVLFVVLVLTIVGPLMLPSGRGLASLPRLLLLPVPHRALFAGELLGGLAEPWTLLAALAVVMVPAGAALAGNVTLALVAASGAIGLIVTLIAVAALFGAVLHLMMRDRKRGEWIIVLVFTLIPLAALLPMFLSSRGAVRSERLKQRRDVEARIETMLERPANGPLAIFPGELYAAATARTAGITPGSALLPLAGLAVVGAGALAGGWTIWMRSIATGGISRGRSKTQRAQSGAPSSIAMMRTPARGIAFSFLQHVLRTARGRTTVLPSIIMTVVLAVMVGVRGGVVFGPFKLNDGFAVALFGVVMAFLSVVQLWMNQFAIDKAGLTMLCVQPLTSGQILRGKMIGAAMLVGAVASLPFIAGLLIGGGRAPAYWLVLMIGAVAAFIFIAPFAALLSIVFPKNVDLTSIGQKSNAHPAAGFIGGLLIMAAAAPAAGATIAGFGIYKSGIVAVAIATAWMIMAIGLHWIIWRFAVKLFDRRRESLMAVAKGR